MQVTNLTQPDPGVQAPVATVTAVSGNSEQLSNATAPVADTLSITSKKSWSRDRLLRNRSKSRLR